jgi:hypothetical protein
VKELWQQAVLPCNLPITILLGLVVLFWIFQLAGGQGLDSADADPGAGDSPAAIGGASSSIMRVINAGAVPLTIVLSVLVLALWIASVLLNFYLNPQQVRLRSVVLFFAAFVLALAATKLITLPLVPLMRRLKASEDTAPVLGETGIVRSIELDSSFGQVEVQRADGAPAILNSRLAPDAAPVPRGTPVVVLSMDEASGVYLVRASPPLPSAD